MSKKETTGRENVKRFKVETKSGGSRLVEPKPKAKAKPEGGKDA